MNRQYHAQTLGQRPAPKPVAATSSKNGHANGSTNGNGSSANGKSRKVKSIVTVESAETTEPEMLVEVGGQ